MRGFFPPRVLLALAWLCAGAGLPAQPAQPAVAQPEFADPVQPAQPVQPEVGSPEAAVFSSPHYEVQADLGEARARQVAERLEAAILLFNEFLHYGSQSLPGTLRVRIFATREAYDAQVRALIGESRAEFVYVSYRDPSRSLLLGFERPETEFEASLLHYGFIQFFSAHIPAAPLWLAEGLATYLERSRYDGAAGAYSFRQNLAWLDSLKSVLRDPAQRIEVGRLVLMDKVEAQRRIDAFYPTSWGLVHFLVNSAEKRYNRVLWEALAALAPELDLAQNSRQASERAFAWVQPEPLEEDFAQFILGLSTFNDHVHRGVEEYAGGRLAEAEASFRAAAGLRPESPLPCYYLGLILYQRRAYEEAAEQYRRAQGLGIDPGLVSYALGVNAFAARQYAQAEGLLLEAKAADAQAYGERVDALLARIRALR